MLAPSRLFRLRKQINAVVMPHDEIVRQQGAFDSKYLNIIKKGDKIICKVEYIQNDIDKGIMLIPKGISKRSIQCILQNDFKNIELKRKLDPTQEFTVVGLKNTETAIVYPSNMIDEK